jgi:hypothetical protein
MRSDSALSHLYDEELCIAEMKDGNRREVRWSQPDWCFYYAWIQPPVACHFDDIQEWWPASIQF